jgi:hypothetical protein
LETARYSQQIDPTPKNITGNGLFMATDAKTDDVPPIK